MSARPHFLRPGLLETRGDINTTMHRCTPLPPLSDDAHEGLISEAELRDIEAQIERMYAAWDKGIFVLFVLVMVVVLADRYAHLLPGGGV